MIPFQSKDDLVPVIVQDFYNLRVLMLGYMNEEALQKTLNEGLVTFYSRSKKRLWTKGETSGNHLKVCEISKDCDQDTLLVKAIAAGPTCHTGQVSCFDGTESFKCFLYQLEETIAQRADGADEKSYTKQLLLSGMNKVAQKVGEEAVELVIEAMDSDRERFKSEAADLLFHFLVLLKAKEIKLEEIESELFNRVK